MCIRALDYCPPVDITFGEYLRAIITADIDLVQDDNRNFRLAFIDAFRRRGIYPGGIKTLSIESLQYKTWNIGVEGRKRLVQLDNAGTYSQADVDSETAQMLTIVNNFLRDYAYAIKYENNRANIYRITKEYISGKFNDNVRITGLHNRLNMKFSRSSDFARITGLAFIDNPQQVGVRYSRRYSGPSFSIQNLRVVNRIGPDGNQINQVVFSVVQRSGVVFEKGKFKEHYDLESQPTTAESNGKDSLQRFEFKGGCTLIFDLDTLKLKYAISKPLLDVENMSKDAAPRIDHKRLNRQFAYQFEGAAFGNNLYSLYFGEQLHNLSEPFSFLHQH
jgi:hypothetical protein